VNEAAGLDDAAPKLTEVNIPAAATTGTPLAFSAQATDVWGTVTTAWDFGDGTAGDGPSASHAFTAAGARTVTVTATDTFGNRATASGTVVVADPPKADPPDTTAPEITALTLTRTTFAVARARTPLAARRTPAPKRGTVIRLTLSEAASVRIVIQREATGRRSGKRCVKATRANRKHKRCTQLISVGTLTRAGKSGRSTIAFSGRLGSKALAPGRYRLSTVATDAAKNASKATAARFVIVRG
jgi:PKD repeat protein